jgi:hypothetical protein
VIEQKKLRKAEEKSLEQKNIKSISDNIDDQSQKIENVSEEVRRNRSNIDTTTENLLEVLKTRTDDLGAKPSTAIEEILKINQNLEKQNQGKDSILVSDYP